MSGGVYWAAAVAPDLAQHVWNQAWPAFALGLALSLVLGVALLPWLRRLRVGQVVRSDGPARHLAKSGTPTMGGLIFALAITIAVAVGSPGDRPNVEAAEWTGVRAAWSAVFGMLGFGAIGLADDWVKVVFRRPLGLRARHKLLLQVALGLGLAYTAAGAFGLGTRVLVPFTGRALDLGWWFYPFVVLVVLATTNTVNLTDGLDGLLAGVSLPGFVLFGALLSTSAFATTPLSREFGHEAIWGGLAWAAWAAAGALVGFLFYNWHPARVFMGDTGSMALGGLISSLAVLSRTELFIPIFGLVYVLEGLSDIVQVSSFRLTGRRVLRMAPLHHHFELGGLSEMQVVARFWALSALAAAASLVAMLWGV